MIKIENFSYSYPNSKKEALKNINLEIKEGEFVLITGPTGSGKSTLLYSINGLIPHIFGGRISGNVIVDGFSPRDKPIREISKHVGTVFQNPDNQIFMLIVEDDVAFGCENLFFPPEESIRRRDYALKRMGLWEIRKKETFKLSGGQKQRLAISSIYAMGPKILLFDEPIADLDRRGRKEFFEILRELKNEGKTILVVEHQYEEFLPLADKVVFLREGRIINDYFEPQFEEIKKIEHKSKNVIELKDIYFEYEKGEPVLRNINLEIKKGELVAILGDNGSGKSTLFKIILGLLKPQKGDVKILNLFNPNLDELIGKVGFLFQNPDEQLFANSVEEEIAFGPIHLKKEVNINYYLELGNFYDLKERHPQTLSRGQRQLLALLSILSIEPEIIILDEPTTGLDYRRWYGIFKILNKLVFQGKTVIFSTHNQRAKEFAHRTIYLQNGKIKNHEVYSKEYNSSST